MNESVTYSVVPRINPAKPQLPVLFYAMAQARGVADIRTLSDRINGMCTVTYTDVIAVLSALETIMAKCLLNGEIVRLGEFGSFQVSISSAGTQTREGFNATFIRSARFLFRPGVLLAAALKIIRYEQVPIRYRRRKVI